MNLNRQLHFSYLSEFLWDLGFEAKELYREGQQNAEFLARAKDNNVEEISEILQKFHLKNQVAENKILFLLNEKFSQNDLIKLRESFRLVKWSYPHRYCVDPKQKFKGPATGFQAAKNRRSKEYLQELYRDDFLVAEKKEFIADWSASSGPYIRSVDDESPSFFDAAGQISTVNIAWNSSEKNPMRINESLWDFNAQENSSSSGDEILRAYKNEILKDLPYKHVCLANSGSESVEIALAGAQQLRPGKKRIIAFEGSFHGRSLLALHTSYNPAKRLPFEISDEWVDFVPFPEMKSSEERENAEFDPLPPYWIDIWENAASGDFENRIEEFKSESDDLLRREITSLLLLREKLKSDDGLACIVEPVLCEGGDRYGSARFFQALRLLTQAYSVPLIFDEVQTGIGMTASFFAFQTMKLQNSQGDLLTPDFICVAKKAQMAACLSHKNIGVEQELISQSSMYRGYLQMISFREKQSFITHLEAELERRLGELKELIGEKRITNTRAKGRSFAFDLPSSDIAKDVVARRFEHGLLFYPAGEKTLRFRVMLDLTIEQLDELFDSLARCLADVFAIAIDKKNIAPELLEPSQRSWRHLPEKVEDLVDGERDWVSLLKEIFSREPEIIYSNSSFNWPLDKLLQRGVDALKKEYDSGELTFLELAFHWARTKAHDLKVLKFESYSQVSDQVNELQSEIYEEARRLSKSEIENTLGDSKGLFIVAFCEGSTPQSLHDRVGGLALSGPIECYGEKVSFDQDETDHFKSESVYYSADLTVSKSLQGQGLGWRLKLEQLIHAFANSFSCIYSRNKVPDAERMMKLNQSMGSLVIKYKFNEYGSNGIAAIQKLPIPKNALKYHSGSERGTLTNKSSLGNFVSLSYINNLLLIKKILPERWRHVYLSSGVNEALDKSIKLLKVKRANACSILSFSDDLFDGAMASARSLGKKSEFFSWPKLEIADDPGSALEKYNNESLLGLVVKIDSSMSHDRIAKIKEWLGLASRMSIPVISLLDREYAWRNFAKIGTFLSSEFPVDIFNLNLGGQLALTACSKELFYPKALQMISTWEGDEHALNLLRARILHELPA